MFLFVGLPGKTIDKNAFEQGNKIQTFQCWHLHEGIAYRKSRDRSQEQNIDCQEETTESY